MKIIIRFDFTVPLEESNYKNYLPLGGIRKGIPLLLRAKIGRWEVISGKGCKIVLS